MNITTIMADEKNDIASQDTVNSTEPRYYTEDEIHTMRAAGEKKPDTITWSQWMTPKRLNTKHHMICYLAASGLKSSAIAEQTGLSQGRVTALLSNPKIKNEIQYLQRQMFSSDPRKRFNDSLDDAIDTVHEVMKNPSEKGSTRLSAAGMVIERVLGKQPQEIDIGQNMVRALFERMDRRESNKNVIDVEAKPAEEMKELPASFEEEEKEVQGEKIQEVRVTTSEADIWIKNNLQSS